MQQTISEFDAIIKIAGIFFIKKMNDFYGTAWRILRISSLTDQIYIKAQRIRSIEDKGHQKIEEDVSNEFVGIVNYAVIGLIQLELGVSNLEENMEENEVISIYDNYVSTAKKLMIAKNHDYGEAWREMRVSSLTDLILQKISRVNK